MYISEEVCKQIEDMASRLIPPSQMAALLNIDEDGLKFALSEHNSIARKAFLRGMANTANKIRETNIDLANAGSPDAIRNCFSSMQTMLNDLSE